jgi:CRP/FNR family transcriptional regulator
MRVEEAIGRIPVLAGLDYDWFRSCCPSAHVRRRQPPEPFFESTDIGDDFVIVVTGRVKLQKRRAGGGGTLDLVTPGNLLCMSRPHACLRYCCDAIADAPNTRGLVIPRKAWLALMADSTAVARYFIDQLGARNELLCQRVEELSGGRVERRLGKLLLRLAEQAGEVEAEGVLIPLSLSRRDLADLVATTPETVTRIMRNLERSGVLETTSRGILVEDLPRIEALVRG